MHGIILAGGSGSRLWPLSRELYPKQLLKIGSNKSLLERTYERLMGIMDVDNILAITNSKHVSDVRMQLGEYNKDVRIIAEPAAKNTAPAISIATKFILDCGCDDIILVVPSDHLIKDTESFRKTIDEAQNLAKQGYIVTLGVKPTHPGTGFGYIKTAQKLDFGYEVECFKEKPDLKTATEYFNSNEYFWNSGIFMFKASVFMQELTKHCPTIAQTLVKMDFTKSDEIPYIEFEKMPNISVDYAVMEKSDKIALVKLECDWNDMGSWTSIYGAEKKDENGNVFVGHVEDMGSKNSLVYSSSKLVATIGLEDVVLVETEDAVLACKKDRTQDVKKMYDLLKQKNDDTHLVHKTVFRPWGYYTVLAQGEGFQTKLIQVNPGQKLSVQSHNYRSEHWVVLSGTAKVVLEGKDYILSPGNSIDIPLKAIHSLQNPFNEEIKIIEVQKGHPLIEEDIIRYEDMYGRV